MTRPLTESLAREILEDGMHERQWTTIDKSQWPERGEWDGEPDKVQWTDKATGLPCLAVRNHGHWCGYVGVAEGHSAFEKPYSDVDVSVHGGLTFTGFCQEHADEGRGICHIPEPWQPARVWWLGFDCAHSGDYRPPTTESEYAINQKYPMPKGYEHYRPLSYVQQECRDLAQQLAEMAEPKLVCEQCGNHVESLREVYSEDRSVGYSEGRWICSDCREVLK